MMRRISPGLDLRTATQKDVEAAFRIGVRAALRAHKKAGVPAIVWDRETGRTIRLPSDQIPDFPDEPLAIDEPSPPA